ncbi:MAG: hypothetical protein HFP77_05975 [Methylococcales symbiont of Iophon sp. n. MRB-2018]|nr:MAG: hypothetical protein HFP77_05975 [Methylococcales symbiont of Iophon sp. n. MRB-2018]KAF3979222.1 MAG: hypothetical protein HFP76_08080 [Methylococcales symbiont of Iophon sp. n. MRB-2018]
MIKQKTLQILLLILLLFISSHAFSLTTKQINKMLVKISNDLNSTLPKMIDSEIQLTSTWTLNKTLIYRGEFINYAADKITASTLREEMTPRLVNTFCTSPELKIYRDNDIKLSYIYFGKNSKHIVSIDISKKQC